MYLSMATMLCTRCQNKYILADFPQTETLCCPKKVNRFNVSPQTFDKI